MLRILLQLIMQLYVSRVVSALFLYVDTFSLKEAPLYFVWIVRLPSHELEFLFSHQVAEQTTDIIYCP